MSAGVNAIDDLDFLLIDQPLHFIDRDVHLALTVGINRDHLVLAGDAAALVNKINRDLRAHRACRRATGSEWTGQAIQAVSRTLKEEVTFDKSGVTSLDWVSYPVLRFAEHPDVVPVVVQRSPEGSCSWVASSSIGFTRA